MDELIRLGSSDIGDIRALTTNPAKAALPESVTAITGYLGNQRPCRRRWRASNACIWRRSPPPSNPRSRCWCKRVCSTWWHCRAARIGRSTPKRSPPLGWRTQLGPGEFCENFAMWAPQIKTGTVRDVAPDYVESPVSMDDIARVAAHLLAARRMPIWARCTNSPAPSRCHAPISPARSGPASSCLSTRSGAAARRPKHCCARHGRRRALVPRPVRRRSGTSSRPLDNVKRLTGAPR